MNSDTRTRFRLACGLVLAILAVAAAPVCADQEADAGAWREEYRRPDTVPFPSGDPFSAAKAKLGRMLFYEPLLSRSGRLSCATCHVARLGWGDGLPRPIGDEGAAMRLRSPAVINLAWAAELGWDGKFKDLEAVAFPAISGPANMDLPEPDAIRRLAAMPVYTRAFATAFHGSPVTRRAIEMALATFERTIVSEASPFDRWVEGDKAALDLPAKRGFALFNSRAHCADCHAGWTFTDGSFHDIGSAQGSDIGRARLVPGVERLRYAFKVPTLRNVAQRARYMHDGSVPTLDAVIDLYDRGGIERPSRSSLIKPLGLTTRDKSDLVAFLRTLSSPAALP